MTNTVLKSFKNFKFTWTSQNDVLWDQNSGRSVTLDKTYALNHSTFKWMRSLVTYSAKWSCLCMPSPCEITTAKKECLNFLFVLQNFVQHRTATSLRQHSFCHEVMNLWKSLSDKIVTAKLSPTSKLYWTNVL